MSRILAIDPASGHAKARMGVAMFEAGVLYYAMAGDPHKIIEHPPPNVGNAPDLVIIENPRWYPREKKIDVNDLLDLAEMVGRLHQHYLQRLCKVELVWPRTWKGTRPKDVHHRQIMKVLGMKEVERMPKTPRSKKYDPNMLDAVGLGLWKLGRMR